ncbi:E3 SUMO-protein ligase ZBED1-like isoform X2 [Simochromis diagramma]|uniref:E3 SUMO-protein ligase ZBED1-like isoform X2 n=1 Tax=Simochromis diagramma TaxID=43689 RepID=UPI001A7E8D5D|nr:E3 SUMO-protein ligase ZBED1-like isoform X2 [Simochromis diagramma]
MTEEERIQPAPTAFKADVWTYFGFRTKEGSKDYDKSYAVCKICTARVKYSGNTTNLRTHVSRHHSDVASNANFKTKRGDPSQRTIEEVNFSKLPATSTRTTKITQSVLVFICKDMRPLSVVENKGFRNMIKTLEPRYTVPSRQHITDIALPKLYQEVKATVLDSLSSAETVALTCDAWTSRATESYVTVTAETSETYSRLLDTVVTVIKKEENQKNEETDKQVEEENATEEAHHPHIKDNFDSIPRPPLK